jgi:DNA replication protein DnaD
MPNSGGVSTGLAQQVVSALFAFFYAIITLTFISHIHRFIMSETLKKLDQSIQDKQLQLDQLKAKKQTIEARLKSTQKAQERKNNTRRKILAGTFFLEAAGKYAINTSINGKTLDEFLTKEDDRLLFL